MKHTTNQRLISICVRKVLYITEATKIERTRITASNRSEKGKIDNTKKFSVVVIRSNITFVWRTLKGANGHQLTVNGSA